MEKLCLNINTDDCKKRRRFSLKNLRLSLKYRPEIFKLVLKMRQSIRMKNVFIGKLKRQLKKELARITSSYTQTDLDIAKIKSRIDSCSEGNDEVQHIMNHTCVLTSKEEMIAIDLGKKIEKSTTNSYTQTESTGNHDNYESMNTENNDISTTAWNTQSDGDEKKSIAEQVKEAAQSALRETGMVYVETAGMYYDYKTGYYYNSELGLYYHTDTGCYYYYSDEKKTFVFHSYPDKSAKTQSSNFRETKKAKKKASASDDIENLTKQLNQEREEGETMPKRRKTAKKNKQEDTTIENDNKKEKMQDNNENKEIDSVIEENDVNKGLDRELEDGECSDTASEASDEGAVSDASTSTASDDETVAKHHPPCMRIIVRETGLPKLKVGSLYLITKDGGTIGREGDHHSIILTDNNVSRNHLDLQYDMDKKAYFVVDLGSKNGTLLNGSRISESQNTSIPMEVVHGSTIQVGETKLLCHIHPGNDTCGHCEPGLIMETQEKEKKVAYTRTCSVQRQHQLELARLKNKYAPKQLEIEETAYNDRAQARREKVGSSHHSEKTQSTDINTFIAPENKGFKLLEKMGWSKGEGLGKDNQGDKEPIPIVSNEGTTGLGSTSEPKLAVSKSLGPATLRLAAKTKMLQPPAKAFQQVEEDSE